MAKKTKQTRNEQTSPEVASKAAALMKHKNKDVRSVAASVLTQAPDKKPAAKKAAKASPKKVSKKSKSK